MDRKFLTVCMLMAAIFSNLNVCNGDDADESSLLYKDSNRPVEVRVDDLLSRMTLLEKIGQMTQIERSVASYAAITALGIGSVYSAGGSQPVPQATVTSWADMVDCLQQAALSTRLQIPILYATDAVHGHNNVYGATIFPHNIGLGATSQTASSTNVFSIAENLVGFGRMDPGLVERIGRATALEVRATGIQHVLAPCLSVCRDPRWGRCYESYSEDAELVISMTKVISGLQGTPPLEHLNGYPFIGRGAKVVACAKYFVGDGEAVYGLNENDTSASFLELYHTHLRPFLEALAKGISTIMVSSASWNGTKMHTNYDLLTRVLKQQMGFQGFTLSSWQGIDKITSPQHANYTYSVLSSINAGIDMVMVPFDYLSFIESVRDLVNNGEISMSRIDDAVRRILRVKFMAGLFENPGADPSLPHLVGNNIHRQLAREAVRRSLVLLKNGNEPTEPLLPLSKNASKIMVAGSHANNMGYQCGGWTISWEGSSGQTTIGTTILEGIQAVVSQGTQVIYEENPDPANIDFEGFSYGIVVVGEPPYAETSGNNNNLTIPSGGIDVINNVCSKIKCLVILISGRPLVVEPYLDQMDAFVAAWLPGSEGQGVSDVIFGDYDFEGLLPRTWFRSVDQLPINMGDEKYDPLFPYGFGITMDLRQAE